MYGLTKKQNSGRTNYPYVVARVQAKRSNLLREQEIEQLTKLDVAEITRSIEEGAYKKEIDELAGRFSGLDLVEAALTINEERVYHQLRQMLAGSGKALLEAFLARNLVEDIKTVLRGTHGGASREEMLKELLLEDLDTYQIFEPLTSETITTLPQVLAKLAENPGPCAPWLPALRKIPEDAGLSDYEDALDHVYYAWLLETVAQFGGKGSKFLGEFVAREIDAKNLQNAARWVLVGQGLDFEQYIIPGGRLLKATQVLELAKSEDLAAFEALLRDYGLRAEPLFEGLQKAQAEGRLAAFVAALHRWHLADLDGLAHRHPMSILPILNYAVQKQVEVRRLRALVRGKAAGLGEDRLKELVP